MRKSTATLAVSLLLGATLLAQHAAAETFDWGPWRQMAVQAGGRSKPLDTLALESLRDLTGRTSFVDPETNKKLDHTALYLAMLFEWSGWDRAANDPAAAMGGYWGSHQPDKWDNAPLLLVDSKELRGALGMADGKTHISLLELSEARFTDPETGKKVPFALWPHWVRREKKDGDFTPLEQSGLKLANNAGIFRAHRMGQQLAVVPLENSEQKQWASIASLLQGRLDEASDPTGDFRKIAEQFRKARTAYLADLPEEFNEASAELLATLKEAGPKLAPESDGYPKPSTLALEVAYNTWKPFRFAWVFTLLAFVFAIVSMVRREGWPYKATIWCFVAGVVVVIIGLGMRSVITGRAPVTNMYESIVFMGWGTILFGLFYELFFRRRYILVATAAVSTVALFLADYFPAIFDPSLRPLQPVE